ncbi:hypothetical protein GCM10023219_10680 [Stakelama sediminis]|uniref:Uncharacterized protein n=1 Tax=Stakelama sediminis TaxID=463200 RepID=A0A840YW55_9SPHN|nr:hypothetical protein [Stakelama sediminis]MBB5717792.1 hypothetical protein [Stakelama sediminis]
MAVVLIAGYFGYRYWTAPQNTQPNPYDQAMLVQAARQRFRRDPSITDIVYVAHLDEWNATPAFASADAKDFAHYVCYQLAESGVAGPHTRVRVIDADRLRASNYDYNAASRGTLTCGDAPE